jgi:hypothetical protein
MIEHSNCVLVEAALSLLSSIFPKSPKQKALDEASKLIWRIIDDELYQNNMLPDEMSVAIKGGLSVDEIPNSIGPFGRVPTNPIPVNGAIGELAYLSRLHAVDNSNLIFHRLGAIASVDVYETVSLNGRHWDILFLDPYHPRKSKRAPEGFQIGRARQFSGFHVRCSAFPYDFDECKSATPDMLRLAYVTRDSIRQALKAHSFDRPASHARHVSGIETNLTSFMSS